MAKRPPTIPDSELDVLKVFGTSARPRSERRWRPYAPPDANGRTPPWRRCSTGSNPKGWSRAIAASWPSCTSPAISTQEVRQRRLTSLVDKLYQGEPGLLVLHLLKSHPLDPSQAKEVRSVLDQMAGEQAPKRNKRDSAAAPPAIRGVSVRRSTNNSTRQFGLISAISGRGFVFRTPLRPGCRRPSLVTKALSPPRLPVVFGSTFRARGRVFGSHRDGCKSSYPLAASPSVREN